MADFVTANERSKIRSEVQALYHYCGHTTYGINTLPMRWHNAYCVILLIGAILGCISIVVSFNELNDLKLTLDSLDYWYSYSYSEEALDTYIGFMNAYLVISVGQVIFQFVTWSGLRNERAYGFVCVFIHMGLSALMTCVSNGMATYLIDEEFSFGMFFFSLLIAAGMYIPNCIYYAKRKGVFIMDSSYRNVSPYDSIPNRVLNVAEQYAGDTPRLSAFANTCQSLGVLSSEQANALFLRLKNRKPSGAARPVSPTYSGSLSSPTYPTTPSHSTGSVHGSLVDAPKFCTACGNKCKSTAKFCNRCGEPLE